MVAWWLEPVNNEEDIDKPEEQEIDEPYVLPENNEKDINDLEEQEIDGHQQDQDQSVQPDPVQVKKDKVKHSKNFKCAKCEKVSFERNSLLIRHQKKCNGMQCPICQKKFNSDKNVERHRAAVHEEKKAFSCKICPRSFAQNSNLKQRIAAVHEKEKPFKCNECDKKYAKKDGLNNHQETAHKFVKNTSVRFVFKENLHQKVV